MIRARRL